MRLIMEEQAMSHETITQILLNTLELRDKDSAGHSHRVAMLALRLGHALGLTDQDLGLLRTGAMLHDIGKIGIPDSILLKPGTLTDDEWVVMRQHPTYGAELLRSIPEMQDIIPIVSHHHEKWDGTGYPDHLTGENIPYLARVCAVTEVFDGLLGDHIYRAAWPMAQAHRWMEQESGKAFDPAIVKALSTIAADS
jgi:putative nucleotidyltransferase with HDIG domain